MTYVRMRAAHTTAVAKQFSSLYGLRRRSQREFKQEKKNPGPLKQGGASLFCLNYYHGSIHYLNT
jgi:hypothetical protein